jgi:non-homologous end joining protein Ku
LADPYAERLLALVRAKLEAGADVFAAPSAPEVEQAEIIDLMEVLKRSLGVEGPRAGAKRARSSRSGAGAAGRSAPKRRKSASTTGRSKRTTG